MYEIPPFLSIPNEILKPTCMYSMKNMYSLPSNIKYTYLKNELPQFGQLAAGKLEISEKISPAEAALANRQLNILSRLKNLKLEMEKYKEKQGVSETISRTNVDSTKKLSKKDDALQNIVLFCNPDQPPFYILPILTEWKKFARILKECKIHSSIDQVDEETIKLFKDDSKEERISFNVIVTVIFKDQPVTSLMVNPLKQTLIYGDSNIIRYISRILPNESPLNFEASPNDAPCVDFWLDAVQEKMNKRLSSKEKQSFLKNLNSKLGTSEWVNGGKTFSISDVMIWSALKQHKVSPMPNNVEKWFKNFQLKSGVNGEFGSRFGFATTKTPKEVKSSESKIPETEKLISCTNKNSSKISPIDSRTEKHPEKEHDPQKSDSNHSDLYTANLETEIIPEHITNHASRHELENFLSSHGIKFQSRDHEAVFTVDALIKVVGDMPGYHMKNLFLKDKKKNLYLLSALHDTEVKLSEVARQINSKDLRFAHEKTLYDVLGVTQGCVTVFSLINDKNLNVTPLLDSRVVTNNENTPVLGTVGGTNNENTPVLETIDGVNKATPLGCLVNFHPLTNKATIGVLSEDLIKFINLTNHKEKLIYF